MKWSRLVLPSKNQTDFQIIQQFENWTKKILYSSVYGIQMFGIQMSTVFWKLDNLIFLRKFSVLSMLWVEHSFCVVGGPSQGPQDT
jgi:hypothetical protein